MRDVHLRYLLLLGAIGLFECAPAGSFEGFSPERVGIRGYVGFTTRKEVELRLNGKPLEKGEIQLSPLESGDNELELLVAPLTGNVLLAFTPQATGLVSSRLQFSYRGSSYSILVIGNGVEAPKCRSSSSICVEYLFNSDSEQCEAVMQDGRPCEAFDCMNPGVCAAGECVRHETPHSVPWCARAVESTSLSPVWTYSPNPPAPVIAPLQFDDAGNSYLLEGYPNTLVSLDASGRARWRTSAVATSIVDEDSASVSFQFSADELFVVDQWSNKLSAVRRTDGTLLWDRVGWGYESTVLPVGDSLWALDFIDGLKLALNVYDPVTGELRRKLAEPLTLDGTECMFADIAGGTDGRVYLTTSDSHGVRDQDAVLVAFDVATGDPVWSTRFPYYSIQWARFSALVRTMLVYDNGTVVDLASLAVFQNEKQWLSFQANPGTAKFIQADGTGFESQLDVFDGCEVKNLSRIHVVESTKDWTCLIGTHRLAGGLIGLTPKGSAIVLGFKAETLDGQSVQRPIITIIRPEGDVAFSGKLMFDPLSLTLPAVVAIRGSRLLIRQSGSVPDTHSIVAYDIPELLTQ